MKRVIFLSLIALFIGCQREENNIASKKEIVNENLELKEIDSILRTDYEIFNFENVSVQKFDLKKANFVRILSLDTLQTKFASMIILREKDGEIRKLVLHNKKVLNHRKRILKGRSYSYSFCPVHGEPRPPGCLFECLQHLEGVTVEYYDPQQIFSNTDYWDIVITLSYSPYFECAVQELDYLDAICWDGEYIGGGFECLGVGVPEEEDDDDDKVEDRLTDKCAKNILNQMRSATGMKNFLNEAKLHGGRHNFSEMILDLFEKSSQTHLVFENGTIETGANGATKGTTIRLDNGYLRNATQLSIARTIIHEMVHAYLNVNYYGYGNKEIRNDNFYNLIDDYFRKNGVKYNSDYGRLHHEFMGQYIDAMATSLQQWDMRYGSQADLGFEYYRAMAFGGLFQIDGAGKISNETDIFKQLVPNLKDRQAIADKIFNEQKGNKDAKGTKCK